MLTVALSFHAGDAEQARRLLLWIGKISNVKDYHILLVADAGTPVDRVIAIQELASSVFKSADLAATPKHVQGWIPGANQQWACAMRWGGERNVPLLWLEPDAVALKPTWLDELNDAYEQCGKEHMGFIENVTQPGLPEQVMSGVGVYGPATAKYWVGNIAMPRAFNVDFADLIVPRAHHTALIKDFFGTKELPPVFVESKTPTSPSHHFTLDWLPAESVLYHRDKSHSLIPLLAKKLGIEWVEEAEKPKRERLAVVFPVHNGDIQLALHHALWLRKLGGRWRHRAVIAFDPTLNTGLVNQFKAHLEQCFESVELFRYVTPPIPAYPASANFMFQSVAYHMAGQHSPWLLMEADAVALRVDWLEQLQTEYERAGKAWMGPHVKGMSHCQGTAIYPADAAHRMPNAMSCGAHEAFDMRAAADVMQDCHDCDHLFFHTWSVLNGQWHPVGGGVVPTNITVELARRIPRSAIAIHRVKDNSLLNLLLTGQYVHE